jgi:hypothetical protein
MPEELTKEEIERRARELAWRVMGNPYVKQEWPRKPKKKGKLERVGDDSPKSDA